MRFVDFEGATHRLAAPSNWDATKSGECGTLPIRAEQRRGIVTLTSYWKPTPAELEKLNNGGAVELMIWSATHPPVSVEVASCEEKR